MCHSLWILVAVLAVVSATGRSPHADLVEKLERSPEGSRFSSNVFEDSRLSLEGLIRKYQYPYEEHQVVTEDGYILTAIRIPHGRDQNNQPGPRPAVLVMHGLLSSAADFVLLGPGNALSYKLAEEGYDVWLLNARGNFHSRNHTTLNPNRGGDPEFWAFSWDEIGLYDVPAYIDYVLEYTGQTKVQYIGHSQGGTSFFVCMSLRPEYNEKIISFQGLAPAAFFRNNVNPFYLFFAEYERTLLGLANRNGIYEVLGRSDLLSLILTTLCRDGSLTQSICLGLLQYQPGGDFNSTMFPAIFGHVPSGASLRQVTHYGQNIRFGTFARYSFGHIQNLAVYGRTMPPAYDLSRVTAKSFLHYGLNDLEVNYRDIWILEEELPDAVAIQVPRTQFNHFDFVWGIDATQQVYETVVQKMREVESMGSF